MIKKVFLLLFILLFFACSVNVDNQNKTDKHQNIKKLYFKKFEWSNEYILLKPKKILKLGSYMIACDTYDGKHFSIIDLKKKKIIRRVVNVGRGPNEMNDIFYMKRVGDSLIQIGDLNLKKVLIFSLSNLIHSDVVAPKRVLNYKNFPLKQDEVLYRLYMLNDSLYTGLGTFNDGELAIFRKGKNTKSFNVEYKYNYPVENRKGYGEISNFQKHQIFKRRISISPDGSHIIYSSMSCFFYKIFEIQNNDIIMKFQRLDYLPEYELINNSIISKQDKKWGFLNYPVATNEAAYLLEQTRLYSEYKFYSSFTKTLLRVGWDGTLSQTFLLDKETYTIEVDEEHKRIWALIYNPKSLRYEFGYYEF